MKKFFEVLLSAALLLAGCGGAEAPDAENPSSASQTPAPSPWEGLTDMAGTPILLEAGSVEAISLDYAVGWNFDREGYVEIRAGDRAGSCQVVTAGSRYWVHYGPGEDLTLVCDQSSLSLDCLEPVKGVLAVDAERVSFYPYPSPEGNFWSLCPRTEKTEKLKREASLLPVGDGVEAQFYAFKLLVDTEDLTWGDLGLEDPGEGTLYYDAAVEFSSLDFYAFTQGEGTQVFEDRAICRIASPDAVTLGEQIT